MLFSVARMTWTGAHRIAAAIGCLLLSLLSAAPATERHYYFDVRNDDPGLAQHTVTAFYQDHSGYLWIATQGGLHAFDGFRYRLFQHDIDDPASLPDNYVTAIAQDGGDRLWLGSNRANVASLDPFTGKASVFTLNAGEADHDRRNHVTALAFDRPRGVWIGSAAGIELLDPQTRRRREWFRFDDAVRADQPIPARASADQVFAIAIAPDETVWAATSVGLLRVGPRADHVEVVAASTLRQASALFVSSDDAVFAGSPDGLFRIDPERDGAERLWPVDAGAGGEHDVRQIAPGAAHDLWLAVSGSGITIVDTQSHRAEALRNDPDMPGSLPENTVTALYTDRSGLLWVGGTTQGFATVDPAGTPFRYIVEPNAETGVAAGNDIRAVWEDAPATLWLGTRDHGLKRYDRSADRFIAWGAVLARAPGANGIAPRHISALSGDNEGALWIGSERGIYRLDAGRTHATLLSLAAEADGAQISAVLPARDGSIWVGTVDRGLAHWAPDVKHWEFFRHEEGNNDSLTHDTVLTLLEDRDQRIWIGSANGLTVLDPVTRRLRALRPMPGAARSLSDATVSAMLQSRDGTLWFGTHNGLNRLDSDIAGATSFTHFLSRDGLAGASVYGIEEDAAGKLWLSTNQGIAAFDREHELFRNYSRKDGLQGYEFNPGAAAALASGELAFGGSNGLNLFDPAAIRLSHYAAPVVITGIQVDRSARATPAPGEDLVMAQNERVVHFEFAALDYRTPQQNLFSFRLHGFDDAWAKAGTRHDATYSNLPPGDYRFEVRASNHDGSWNDQPTTVGVIVEPPWWMSRLLLALYVALVLLVLARISQARAQKRQAELAHHHELTERENRLRLALWGSGDEFWDWDLRRDELVATGVGEILGAVSPDRPVKTSRWIQDNVHPDDRAAVEKRIREHLQGQSAQFESEHRLKDRKGEWVWAHARGKVVERDEGGEPLRICGTLRDITASRAAERERRISAEVIDSMTEAVCVTDLEFRFVSVNRAFTHMTGHEEAAVVGQSAALLNCSRHPPEFYQTMREQFLRHGHWRGELWQKRRDGSEFLCWLEISVVLDAAGEQTHYVGVMSDITDRKRAEQELRYLANYDTMTGLPNRALLTERLAQAVSRGRHQRRAVGVLFLDLDRFKHVNDSMGHAAGDRTLRATGVRLRECVAPSATIARLGGDEFTVVLENIEQAADAERVARELLRAFAAPLHLESGEEVLISPSIGISVYPDHGEEPDQLLKYADTAMYQAKERGRNTYMVYAPAMDAAARARANLIAALHRGLERHEFSLVYQPKLSLRNGRITGVEALLRWRSEELGQIPPATFIPLAEEAGIVIPIGDFVLDAACAQLRRWHDQGLTHLTVAVNLSMLQLDRGELTTRLRQILGMYHLRADSLELELTESVVMATAERSVSTLTELKNIGVTLTIDDFGTGYSSLSYLKRLPIDSLKIDRAFVGDITTDPDDKAITSTIIAMAHSLDLNVIAEGVETPEQLEYLRERGCDEIQGHWFCHPLDAEACFAFMTRADRSAAPAATA